MITQRQIKVLLALVVAIIPLIDSVSAFSNKGQKVAANLTWVEEVIRESEFNQKNLNLKKQIALYRQQIERYKVSKVSLELSRLDSELQGYETSLDALHYRDIGADQRLVEIENALKSYPSAIAGHGSNDPQSAIGGPPISVK